MRHIEGSGLVAGLQGQMQFGLILLEDHEADRIAVFEGFAETKDIDVEVVGFAHILDREHGGNSPEANTVIGDVIHRFTSYLGEFRAFCGRCRMRPVLLFSIDETVLTLRRLNRKILSGKVAAQALPIRTPAASTSPPPSTTWKAARRNGVSIYLFWMKAMIQSSKKTMTAAMIVAVQKCGMR